ncbi:hypothetical protein [Autumnicola musiva]|uniref:Integrase n=1 Tax=Autumnicola musiva TaxID=3075589 RepID=A0ABU3D633_9FLAO|nr:hypothetical protein [Zunongwangia sp. F117]MDT0676992.1 hypothetical protein [Zunongwangia sp. F117]
MKMEINLVDFINIEKKHFSSLKTGINWEDSRWNVSKWLPHRGHDNSLVFNTFYRTFKKLPPNIILPEKKDLPSPYMEFTKAVAVYIHRTKNVGFMSIRNCVNECRRLHIIMYRRGENSPTQLTRWHFEEVVQFLKEIEYKNLFDTATNLQVIADIIELKKISSKPIGFSHGIKSENRYYNYQSTQLAQSNDLDFRKEEKLPSYEALVAYAKCSNNPINNYEEILLRTIDLLIVTGLRGNEITHLPYDCWVEKPLKDPQGLVKKDFHGNDLINIGIRYFAEKQFQSRVHWFAKQDIPMAKRAVERIKTLTEETREIAKWQEKNKNKLWQYEKDEIISTYELIEFLGYRKMVSLDGYLKKHNIKHTGTDKSFFEYKSKRTSKIYYSKFYRAGDIEEHLLNIKREQNVFLEEANANNNKEIKLSGFLVIRPEGAFRFKRFANTFKILPGRVTLTEINYALGINETAESIFERRNLTEPDGTKIRLTSHQPRHWRNTLYELAGMSNVQQALAMGRQNLTQNKAYQHTTIREKTGLHQEFLGFSSVGEKISFLHDGVRNKSILGDITNTYHYLKKNENLDSAESFLRTHGLAIHLTPFGGCTHDFSQSPCQKHLQCWNGCSHLHRTNTPGETERIREQLVRSKEAHETMISQNDSTYGKDVWTKDLEKKIKNLERSLKITPSSTPIQIFPEGEEFTKPVYKKKNSSV